ncbi:MAG TPA: hypothetical protein VF647_22440 [Longimicrobium sp.]|jgi:hypothetical protein
MADINVERKRSGPNFLPWLLGLVLLAALIWGAMRFMGNDDDETTTPTTTESTTTTTS